MARPAPHHLVDAVIGFFIVFLPAIILCTLLAEHPKTCGPQVPDPDPAKRRWLFISDARSVLPLLILTAFPTRNGTRAVVKENAELQRHVLDELKRRRRKVLLR